MEKQQFIEDYLKYIGENPNVKADKQFKCTAWTGEDPFMIGAAPFGTFYLYPKFAVFLTTSKSKPGGFKAFVEVAWHQEFKPLYYMAKWSHNPASILIDVAKTIYKNVGDKEAKFVSEALSSPNSFFIPFDKITEAKQDRTWRGIFIRIHAAGKKFTLHNNPRVLWSWQMIAPAKALITGKWHPDAVEILAKAASQNKRR